MADKLVYKGQPLSNFLKSGTTPYPGYNMNVSTISDASYTAISTVNSIPGFAYSGTDTVPIVVAASQVLTATGNLTIPPGCNALKFELGSRNGINGVPGAPGAPGPTGPAPASIPGWPGRPGWGGQPGGAGKYIGIGPSYYTLSSPITSGSVTITSFTTTLTIDGSGIAVANSGWDGASGSSGAPGDTGGPGPAPVHPPSPAWMGSPAPPGNAFSNIPGVTKIITDASVNPFVRVYYFIV
jgi:hypothetical protein